MNTGMEIVSRDICCTEIQQGCDRDEDGTPEYIGGTCNDGECSSCNLNFYSSRNYFNAEGQLLQTIVDYENEMT